MYHYYRCANGKKQHSKLTYVSEATIVRGFASAAESIAIDVVIADELTRILNESHAATRAERRRESAKFQRELEDIDANENKLFDLLSSGTIDEPSYKRTSASSNASANAAPKPRRSSRRPTRTWTTPSSIRCEAL